MKKIISVLAILSLLGGCAMTAEQRGSAIGGGSGAVIGGVLGSAIGGATGSDNRTRDAAVGVVVGSVLGAIIGKRLTQQQEELKQVPGVDNVNYDEQQQTIEATLRILFDYDKAQVKAIEAVKLDELANVFAKYPENIITLEGHTDSDGSDAYNQKLSEQRAAAIERYLRHKNLNIARLTSVGYGESRPIASNATASGKAQNRRVEIKISVDPKRVPQTGVPQGTPYN